MKEEKLTSWGNGIDAYPKLCTILGHSSGETDHSTFGRGISRPILPTDQAENAGDVDDGPSIFTRNRFLSNHLCGGVFAAEEDSSSIDTLCFVPPLIGHCPYRLWISILEENARIVYEAVRG